MAGECHGARLVFVPEINHYTQARDLIAVMRDVAADSFTLEVSVCPPREPRRSIDVSIGAHLDSAWPSNTWSTAAEAAARFGAVVGEAA